MGYLALDTETTGIDFRHGAAVFFVTTCDENGDQEYWEWDVDPLTRRPVIPPADVYRIRDLIGSADKLILQNSKFDFTALEATDPRLVRFWDWSKVEDTLIAGHLLSSNTPHDLTSMGVMYAGVDISRHEESLQKACVSARRVAKRFFPTWSLAKKGRKDMPSAGETVWKYDTWLPRLIFQQESLAKTHKPAHWEYVVRDYANADSAITFLIWQSQQALIQERKLDAIYRERLKVLRIAQIMEGRGVSVSGVNLDSLEESYEIESQAMADTCVAIADSYGYELELPRGGINNSLREFCFDRLKLPPLKAKKSKTNNPTLNKGAIEYYKETLPNHSKPLKFIRSLSEKRARDTALAFMRAYRRFWVPIDGFSNWWRLHPSINPTGTKTIRWSSSNPNEQNISKREGFNLRYCFGPGPGREWWSMDAQNIELRIPAYESGEEAFIALFERPDDPPYFGSNHLLVAHILHPKEFEACVNDKGQVDGRIFKKKYAATLYQRTKNGNFAVQYGAVDREDGMGTADRTYGIPGAQARIKARFRKQEELNQRCIAFANQYGYVETIPDRTVDPDRGYPIMCARTERGGVKPTLPLNYHVQGTAMWWMMKAMIRCQERIDQWNSQTKLSSKKIWMTMQVHDELVFDFPKGEGPEPWKTNLPRIKELRRLMEMGGDDIGVPTPTSCEYHADNWSSGMSV